MIQFLNKYALTEFTLLVISQLAKTLLMKLFFIYGLIASACCWELRKYMKACAYITDVEGNVKGKYILNHFLLKKGGNVFGNPIEPISYGMGIANRLELQNKFSKKVENLFLESVEKNHCEKAVITLDQTILNRAKL